MKKLFTLLIVLCPLFAFAQGVRPRVTVEVADAGRATMWYVPVAELADGDPEFCTATTEGRSTLFAMPDDGRVYYAVVNFAGADADYQAVTLVLLPGEKVSIRGSMHDDHIDYTITGSRMFEAQSIHRREEYMELEGELLRKKRRSEQGDFEAQAMAEMVYKSKYNYIVANPDHPLSAYYATTIFRDGRHGRELYDMLDGKLRGGDYKPLLDFYLGLWDEMTTRQTMVAGARAPELTMTDSDGELFSLAGLRGNDHVVVHFWGSWSVPCTREMKRIWDYYEKYFDRTTFIAVDNGDEREDWQRAMERFGIEWRSVFDGDNGVRRAFGVETYPTKIVIDPRGVIVGRFEGVGDDFFDFMDTLFR